MDGHLKAKLEQYGYFMLTTDDQSKWKFKEINDFHMMDKDNFVEKYALKFVEEFCEAKKLDFTWEEKRFAAESIYHNIMITDDVFEPWLSYHIMNKETAANIGTLVKKIKRKEKAPEKE